MKRRVGTLYLEDIVVRENGRRGNADAENIILVGLIWPRPMIDLRTAAKSARLEDGETVLFRNKPFHEKILFKEIVSGEFGVTVEVTERRSPGAVAAFLSGIATNIVNAAFPLPPSSETFRRIVHAGVSGAAAQVRSGDKETIVRIGFGHALIDPSTAGEGILDIDLIAPETIGAPAAKSKRAPLLTKDTPNGRARIRYVIEDD